MKKNNLMNRSDMKYILGGSPISEIDPESSCTALCPGNLSVTCKGKSCMATDNDGCESDVERKKCIVA